MGMTHEEAIMVFDGLLNAFNESEHGDYFYDHGDEVCQAAIVAIAALGGQDVTDINVGNKWISVEERLPEINTKVLVRYKHTGEPHKRSTAFDYLYVSATNPVVFNWTQHPCRVTHWMPLPMPPKEEV